MPLFRRNEATDAEVDDARLRVSSEAKAIAEQHPRDWRKLVRRVGADEAIEHVEVSSLMALVDSQTDITAKQMQLWRAGIIDSATIIEGMAAIEDSSQAKLDVLRKAISESSTRPESMDIKDESFGYNRSIYTTARAFLNGTITEQQIAHAFQERQAWEAKCNRWDAVSRRPKLPLVGDR